MKAIHGAWGTAELILGSNGRIRHVIHKSLGEYALEGDVLHVKWDEFVPDEFVSRDDTFVQRRVADARSVTLLDRLEARIRGRAVRIETVCLQIPGSAEVVEVRPGTSDVHVFDAIFLSGQYASPGLFGVQTILDLGANIGLASVFYAGRYPEARIVAVEPDAANMRTLRRNIVQRPNITAVEAAVWHEDATLSLRVENALGERLQDWSFQTSVAEAPGSHRVPAFSIPTLMNRYDLRTIDLLKVDIEGAEHELFAYASDEWLSRTRCIVVETHERFKPGSDAAVTARLAQDFTELPPSGEDRIFLRTAR